MQVKRKTSLSVHEENLFHEYILKEVAVACMAYKRLPKCHIKSSNQCLLKVAANHSRINDVCPHLVYNLLYNL